MQLRPYQNDLVEQVRQAYKEGYKRPCIVLGCGGGKSIIVAEMAKRATDKGNRVLFLVHRQELCSQIYKTFFHAGVNMKLCKIGMVQTITRGLNKLKEPSLIITDENHHCLAKSYQRIYDRFPNSRCIGVTATPTRLNGSGLGEVNDKLILGVSTEYLIKNEYLAPFDYYAPKLIDSSELSTRNGEFVVSEMNMKPAIYGDVVRHYQQLCGGKQAICYCATIEHSIEMAKQFNAAGIPAEHIDGKTPKDKRSAIVEQFRSGEILILCNVDLISEGFDVPDCTASILLRPTKSLTLFIQQSMRCMRYKPGKTAVIIDHVGNCARFGLPDLERKWDLNAKPKRKNKGEEQISIRQCPACFRVFPPQSECPFCGYVFPKKEIQLEEIKEAVLEKVSAIVMDYTTPEECHSVLELQSYAKNHGYKPGWAYYQAKTRGLIA